MVIIPMVLAACSELPLPDVIRGLQIVAIESIPAEPEPIDQLKLKIWVADGQGLGADVLVWICTPVPSPDGKGVRCAEAYALGGTGLPLSIFTRVGSVDAETGPSFFESTNSWPLFASIAYTQYALPVELRGKMIVGALACSPGLCPLMEQARIDPSSGSDAWSEAHGALADLSARGARSFLVGQGDFLPPEQSDLDSDRAGWLYDLPRGQVSLAAKYVPVYLPELIVDTGNETTDYGYISTDTGEESTAPNQAPSLQLTSEIGPNDRIAHLSVEDPDGDTVQTRAFVTAGGVYTEQDTGLEILWHEPLESRRPAEMFVVAEDGRGGTAVWQWGASESTCSGDTLIPSLGLPDAPLTAGSALPLVGENDSIGVTGQLGVNVPWYFTGPSAVATGTVSLYVGDERLVTTSLGSSQTEKNLGGCSSTWGPTYVPLGLPRVQACALAGQIAQVVLTVQIIDEGELTNKEETQAQVVLTASPGIGCDLP